jgi:hypothetical protein
MYIISHQNTVILASGLSSFGFEGQIYIKILQFGLDRHIIRGANIHLEPNISWPQSRLIFLI